MPTPVGPVTPEVVTLVLFRTALTEFLNQIEPMIKEYPGAAPADVMMKLVGAELMRAGVVLSGGRKDHLRQRRVLDAILKIDFDPSLGTEQLRLLAESVLGAWR